MALILFTEKFYETLQQIVEKTDDVDVLQEVAWNSNATPETLDIVNKKIG